MKKNLSIKTKLLSGFVFILFGILWMGAEGLTTMNNLSGITANMYKHPLTVIKASLQANNALIKMHRSVGDITLGHNETEVKKAVQNVNSYDAEALEQLQIVEKFILGEGHKLIADVLNTFKDFRVVREDTIKLMLATNETQESAIISKEKLSPIAEELSKKMDALTEFASIKAAGFNENAKATYEYVFIWMVATIAVLFISCIFIAYILIKHITQPLNSLQSSINYIESNSDLTHQTSIHRKDEFGSINILFNSMIESFNQAIGKVANSSVEVSTSAENTAKINVIARDSIASQNDQLHQLAASIEEMTASIAEVAGNTTLAAESADNAKNETLLGADLVLKTSQKVSDVNKEFSGVNASVKQLEEKGNEVTAVLDVIKSIADQTNLLALNAAIEAARAGEQGRGFAVVADEVRTLAQRTQDSTSEIEKTLGLFSTEIDRAVSATNTGQEKVAECLEQAEKATSALTNITIAVETIQEMSQQIATAAEQQSGVTGEISAYIAAISEASSDTLNNINESNTAMVKQSEMANQLKNLSGKFTHS